MEEQEVLDVVDIDDQVIRTINRKDFSTLSDNEFIRFAEIFIQRPDGKIWLPRRSLDKKIAPGGLDMSAAGHVLSGETYEQAATREINEETGLHIKDDQLQEIGLLHPGAVRCFRKLFFVNTDQQVVTNSEEHTAGEWIQPDTLATVVDNDVPTKETLYENIQLLSNYLKGNKAI